MLHLPDLSALKFDPAGLIPVIALDHDTGEVRMVAWADREAIETSVATGEAHYHSRSRDKLWRKGEESGNIQKLLAVKVDCDGDALLYLIRQQGPACHTGARSCFAVPGEAPPHLFAEGALPGAATLGLLAAIIRERRAA